MRSPGKSCPRFKTLMTETFDSGPYQSFLRTHQVRRITMCFTVNYFNLISLTVTLRMGDISRLSLASSLLNLAFLLSHKYYKMLILVFRVKYTLGRLLVLMLSAPLLDVLGMLQTLCPLSDFLRHGDSAALQKRLSAISLTFSVILINSLIESD